MSTPIFNAWAARAAGLICVTYLAACDASLTGEAPAPEVTRVAGNQLLIGGPEGYCIDQSSTRKAATNAFVVMARCDALGGGTNRPNEPALLTVAVAMRSGDVGLPAAQLLAAQAKSPEGRLVLAGNGELLETRVSDGVFYARLKEVEGNAALTDTHWRAIFDLKGHLITARVSAFKDNPIAPETGFSTLNALAKRLKADNAVSQVETIPNETGANDESGAKPAGILRRIFG